MPPTSRLTSLPQCRRPREGLLDENLPIALLRRLRSMGIEAAHITELGERGLTDRAIVERYLGAPIVFLTQDNDFARITGRVGATVVVSRVDQARPIGARVEIWARALQEVLATAPVLRLLEIDDAGVVSPFDHLERGGALA
jgi:predicted nuclease of predicted toxin-antitoxin system